MSTGTSPYPFIRVVGAPVTALSSLTLSRAKTPEQCTHPSCPRLGRYIPQRDLPDSASHTSRSGTSRLSVPHVPLRYLPTQRAAPV